MKTFEEATEEQQEEREETEHHQEWEESLGGDAEFQYRQPDLESATDNVRDISQVVPEDLIPGGEPPDFGRQRPSQPGFDIDLGRLDQQGLLEVQARAMVSMLSALFDIADAVEPVSTITVSGTNAISVPYNPEPVIPESDTQMVPTRTIFVRANRDNDEPIAFGDDGVAPQSGFVLESGESITIDLDLREAQLWMSSEERGQQVHLLGMA
jgi:hypothetical protein